METLCGIDPENNMTDIPAAGCRSRSAILFTYIVNTLPRVKKLLRHWEAEACRCQDPELRKQARASLQHKAFHCQGGAVYAVNCRQLRDTVLRLIIAYQTICDYLDNLCDRAGSTDEKAFEQLHRSLFDALTPASAISDYYAFYPYRDDGGYLLKLVNECRSCIEQLPAYSAVYPELITLAQWYADLQIKKHLAFDCREQVLREWAEQERAAYPGMLWQEFAAASGSTLAVFALFTLAANGAADQKSKEQVMQAYFPWICGLHILLDYYIDQEEDRQGGDLNFTFYYDSRDEMLNRFRIFINQSQAAAALLPSAVFDGTVVQGLLALYLSDKKVEEQGLRQQAGLMLNEAGPGTRKVLSLCRLVRRTFLVG